MTDFDLTTRHTDADLALAHAAGDLDVSTAPLLRTQGLALIAQGHRHLILDLGDVTFCDSSGFNALIGLFRCATEAGGTLVLTAVPDRLARLLDLTGLSTVLPSHPTAAHALVAHTRTPDPAGP